MRSARNMTVGAINVTELQLMRRVVYPASLVAVLQTCTATAPAGPSFRHISRQPAHSRMDIGHTGSREGQKL